MAHRLPVRLPDVDPSAVPPPVAAARLRPLADWHPDAAAPRPAACVVFVRGLGFHTLRWGEDHDRRAGREVEVFDADRSSGLPFVRWKDSTGHLWSVVAHPCWLDDGRPPAAPTACVCPILHLMTRGCTCGQMARERKAVAA